MSHKQRSERSAPARKPQSQDLEAALRPGAIRAVYQPVFELASGRIVGYEALARFDQEPCQGPALWFEAASGTDLLRGLELAAVSAQLAGLPELPESAYLALNVSPATACSPELAALLAPWPLDRLVLEVTAQRAVEDHAVLAAGLAELRGRGLRLALDDALAESPSLGQLLALRPDIVKLDVSLIRGIDADPGHRSIASALVAFALAAGITLVAEGIETAAEFTALLDLGVVCGQGFFLARPASATGHEPGSRSKNGAPSAGPNGKRVRVAVVDDHAVVAQAVAAMLDSQPGLEVSGVALDLTGAFDLLDAGETDVVVCDIQLGNESGFSLLKRYQGQAAPRVVMYTAYDHPMYHRAAFEGGASAFVLKMEQPKELVAAILAAGSGRPSFSPATLKAIRSSGEIPTARELAVLERLADGLSTAETASALGIAPRTVESHLRTLFDRAGVLSRTELVLYAIRQGWIRPRAGVDSRAEAHGRWIVDSDLLKAANAETEAPKRPIRRGIR